MASADRLKSEASEEQNLPESFLSISGLKVYVDDKIWELAPLGKGKTINVAWIGTRNFSPELKSGILELLIFYSETKSAATVSTVNTALSASFTSQADNQTDFRNNWISLKSSTKKTLKGSLSNAMKLQMTVFEPYYDVAKQYKHKPKFNGIHPTKGRLSTFEYDSILENLRTLCDSLPNAHELTDKFFIKSNSGVDKRSWVFSTYRNLICYRTLVQIARRPKQISFLKWCDILPIGTSFANDLSEPIQTNISTLHVRAYLIKQANNGNSFRSLPEKWTIPLSESFSKLLIKYKKVYIKGLKLAFERQRVKISDTRFFELLGNMPVFPHSEIFDFDFKNEQLVEQVFTNSSSAFHVSEENIDRLCSVYGKGLSEINGTCIGSNNRLRHTWLCNAALEGLSLNDICKITNVSQPAARYYLQLGLKEREFIDENYAANRFLREAFNPKTFVSDSDKTISSEIYGAVGVEKDSSNCNTCATKSQMNRPIPCYGCPNFRPLLDAEHQDVLNQALSKYEYLSKISSSSVTTGSLLKLKKSISYIKLTIEICDLIKADRNSISQGAI